MFLGRYLNVLWLVTSLVLPLVALQISLAYADAELQSHSSFGNYLYSVLAACKQACVSDAAVVPKYSCQNVACSGFLFPPLL